MFDKAVYAGLMIAGAACLMLAFLSTSPSLEDCVAKIGNVETCRYALR